MAIIKISSEELEGMANNLKSLQSDYCHISNSINMLIQRMDSLLSGSEVFNAHVSEFNKTTHHSKLLLDGMITEIENIKMLYMECVYASPRHFPGDDPFRT